MFRYSIVERKSILVIVYMIIFRGKLVDMLIQKIMH